MKSKRTAHKTRLINLLLLIMLLFSSSTGRAAPSAQDVTPTDRAVALLSQMTPEERVGQLFLVTFNGPDAESTSELGSQIYQLITSYHVGGVILTASNDNFVGANQTVPYAISLIQQLQRNEYLASQQTQINPNSREVFTPAYVPLFIGIAQNGDGASYDQILSGLTPLPSQMSIGATWQPELAQNVGTVLGQELSSIGFNLLLGPSLDVLVPPFSESGGDLGVRVFGGDPFWVGEMGRAFITGVHQGSNNSMVVVAKQFPGFGGSDRLPEEEVATVRSSLEQLKQVELYPFFAVTGNAPNQDATADALLVSHIRYQGFQGNVRATTKPVSFDAQAFSQLMSLPEFASWRQAGGVTISDDLGSRAVRRFYDPSGLSFNGRLVARDAFLAGNDMLYLGDFSTSDQDSFSSMISTISFFAEKYREDAVFAQRVDESALRILAMKYRIYGDAFIYADVIPNASAADSVGNATAVTFKVAQQGATLISPSLEALDEALPDPPGRSDRIVFLTNLNPYQQCALCRQYYTIPLTGLQDAVTRLYSGSGQIRAENMVSYSFGDLLNLLDGEVESSQLDSDLRRATWIVFVMGTVSPNNPSSQALRLFLNLRPDLYQNKRLIGFSLAAPYYLDATDISKLTAYYGLYSRSDTFIESAARLLFQELLPTGDLPVSVPGAGYDLNAALFPNPNQTIELYLDLPAAPEVTQAPETTPTPPTFRTGDSVNVRTGVILDSNGHIVPDGTLVRFILSLASEGTILQQVETQTSRGTARATLRLDQAGQLHIRAESDPAKLSTILTIDIPSEIVTGTPPPTPTETPTPTSSETATATTTATLTPTPTPEVEPIPSTVNLGDWLVSMIVACLAGAASFALLSRYAGLRWGMRAGFLALSGGLAAYSYLAVGLPGSQPVIQNGGTWSIAGIALVGALLGNAVAWMWYFSAPKSQSN